MFEGSDTLGPAIFLVGSKSVIDRCLISRISNQQTSAAVAVQRGVLTVCNSIFIYDIVHAEPLFFGSAALTGSNFRGSISNCIFYDKSHSLDDVRAISVGGFNLSTVVGVTNSIISGRLQREEDKRVQVSYSNVIGGREGPGNIDADPLFVDPDNNDFRLMPGSPCIDAGTTATFFTDSRGNDHKIEIPKVDFDGNPRPLDVPGVGRDGEGAFDMGAFEFQGPFRNSRTDINQDGRVDALDLTILLGDWKKVSGP